MGTSAAARPRLVRPGASLPRAALSTDVVPRLLAVDFLEAAPEVARGFFFAAMSYVST